LLKASVPVGAYPNGFQSISVAKSGQIISAPYATG